MNWRYDKKFVLECQQGGDVLKSNLTNEEMQQIVADPYSFVFHCKSCEIEIGKQK
jgi:hypothetical protein